MRAFGILALSVALAAVPAPASAGAARRCRKVCKPAVAACMVETAQSRRACKRSILPRCKQEGLQVCSPSTTTPTTEPGATTTSSTLPSGGGGGVMSVDVNDVTLEGDADPRLYTLSIAIEYSVVTANAAVEVALDPAAFTVLDEDTGIVYPAEPAAAPEDCSAARIVARDGPAVTCTLRFLMPSSVGASSVVDGGVHAKLEFEALGLHGSEYWSSL